MGRVCQLLYKRLALMLAEKRSLPHQESIAYIYLIKNILQSVEVLVVTYLRPSFGSIWNRELNTS